MCTSTGPQSSGEDRCLLVAPKSLWTPSFPSLTWTLKVVELVIWTLSLLELLKGLPPVWLSASLKPRWRTHLGVAEFAWFRAEVLIPRCGRDSPGKLLKMLMPLSPPQEILIHWGWGWGDESAELWLLICLVAISKSCSHRPGKKDRWGTVCQPGVTETFAYSPFPLSQGVTFPGYSPPIWGKVLSTSSSSQISFSGFFCT